MIGRTNAITAGGSTLAYAVIQVTFPAGSVITASKGTRTIYGTGTAGDGIIIVPEAGTWTVNATNGKDSAQKNVVISKAYQVVPVSLRYGLELFTPKTTYQEYRDTWEQRSGSYASVYMSNGAIILQPSAYGACAVYTINKLDLSKYKTLNVRCTSADSDRGIDAIRIGALSNVPGSSATNTYQWLASQTFAAPGEDGAAYSASIAGVSAGYIAVYVDDANISVTDIWLD